MPKKSETASESIPIRRIRLLRMIGRLLPLKHRLFPLVQNYPKTTGLVTVPWGEHKLSFPSDWPVFAAAGFIFEGTNLNPEFQLLRKIMKGLPEGIIVDVGANIGTYVLEFRRQSNLPIVAYEPAPAIVDLLMVNVASNDLKNVEIRNAACGERQGSLSLDAGINSSVSKPSNNGDQAVVCDESSNNRTLVPMVALDEEFNDSSRVSLIKVDCEGFEYHVLSGAQKLLERHRPFLLIELHPNYIRQYGFTPEALCELLRPMYDLQFFDFSGSRKRGRVLRLISRYFPNQIHRFASEAKMLDEISKEPTPNQIFIVGSPKLKGSELN